MVEEYQVDGDAGCRGDLFVVSVYWHGLWAPCVVEVRWPREVGVNLLLNLKGLIYTTDSSFSERGSVFFFFFRSLSIDFLA